MKTQPLTYAEHINSVATIVAALLVARPDDYLTGTYATIATRHLRKDAELIWDECVASLAQTNLEIQEELIADEKAEDEPFKT